MNESFLGEPAYVATGLAFGAAPPTAKLWLGQHTVAFKSTKGRYLEWTAQSPPDAAMLTLLESLFGKDARKRIDRILEVR